MKLALHTKILIGLLLGLLLSVIILYFNLSTNWVIDWIKPIGSIFINLLKMVAVPLVITSVVIGIANLSDVSKLSDMGLKTIALYLTTTLIAITIGLTLVNILQPGLTIPEDVRMTMMETYKDNVETRTNAAEAMAEKSPLQPLVDMVPSNIFAAFSNNMLMLQVVFFAVLLGVALLSLTKDESSTVISFFNGLNEAFLKIIDFIMWFAPYGVFALMVTVVVEVAGQNPDSAFSLIKALLYYTLTVILGLVIMVNLVYPTILRLFTPIKYMQFFEAIRPAQLVAFSTSSSASTLPVTMKSVEQNLGVKKNVSSFVLPLGATVNMDGTSLYQAVAAVFIAQALGIDLSITQQLTIVITALLASVGSAGVPGAGIVMLLIVLESIGVPAAGIALILAPDRFLDMGRTMVNVTGDAMVCATVSNLEKR